MTDWLSPLNKLTWMKAFKKRASQVTIDDGRKFNCDYSRKGEVQVTPVEGFVPRGAFELRSVTHSSWLDQK